MTKKTLAAIEKIVKKRLRISVIAGRAAAKAKDARLMDYHAGCQGVCYCILEDVRDFQKRKRHD